MHTPILPIDVITGRRAAGWRKPRLHAGESGPQPIWPIAGGAEDDDPDNGGDPDDDDDGDDPDPDDDPDGGDDKKSKQPKPKPPAKRGKDDDPGDDIARLKKELADARKEAGKSRTEAKQKAAEEAEKAYAQKVAKALGLVEDDEGEPDPAKLMEQLTEKETAATAAQEEAIAARVELTVVRTAYGMGVDGDKLLDSRKFCEEVDGLDAEDPKKFKAALKAVIKDTAEKNPALRIGQQPKRSGSDLPGGPPEGGRAKRSSGLSEAIKGHYGT